MGEMKENWKKSIEQAEESYHTWLHKAAESIKCLSSHLNGNWQWMQCCAGEIWMTRRRRNALWYMCSFESACNGTNTLLTNNYQSILIHPIPANLVSLHSNFRPQSVKRPLQHPEMFSLCCQTNPLCCKIRTNSPFSGWGRELLCSL